MSEKTLLDRRLELDSVLRVLLGESSSNCYFQPPESVKLKYPCIVYHRNSANTIYANNKPYRFRPGYTLTIISKDPDDELVAKVSKLPLCRFDRHFTKDNLNHDVFTIYW